MSSPEIASPEYGTMVQFDPWIATLQSPYSSPEAINEARKQIFEQYEGPLYGYIYKRAGPEGSDDIYQETALAVLDHIGRYDPAKADLGVWMRGIANHKIVDYWRGLRREEELPTSEIEVYLEESSGSFEANNDPAEIVMAADGLHKWNEIVAQLPPSNQEVVKLKYAGLSESEIAELLDKPLGSVKGLRNAAELKVSDIALGAVQNGEIEVPLSVVDRMEKVTSAPRSHH